MVQLSYATATRRTQPLPASTASYLASSEACCQAALGDAQACDRALGEAAEHFTHADPSTAAPWAARVTAAELTARQGNASYTLAQTTTDPKRAARAVPLLQQAVDGRGRALNLAALAGAHALTGDVDTAARTSHHAVQEIIAIALPRAYERLRTLDTVLQPHATTPAVKRGPRPNPGRTGGGLTMPRLPRGVERWSHNSHSAG